MLFKGVWFLYPLYLKGAFLKSHYHHEAQIFLERLFAQAPHLPRHWDIDHLCFRVESEEEYQRVKKEFSSLGNLLVESPVAGRLISTFQLDQPLEFDQWRIDLIELPAPKPGKNVKQGFEHIEVVCDIPFINVKQLYSQAQFSSKALTKRFNAELEMSLEAGQIKFHQLSLLSVIELENHKKAWKVLEKLNLLEKYHSFDPLIAGTLPLALATENSDLDILLNTQDLEGLSLKLENDFSAYDSFNIILNMVNDLPSLICSFTYDHLKIELFAQARASVEQVAYQHFLIEEKLLKYGASDLRSRVLELKNGGMKTELAFAQALGIEGDSYQILLEWQRKSIGELRAFLVE